MTKTGDQKFRDTWQFGNLWRAGACLNIYIQNWILMCKCMLLAWYSTGQLLELSSVMGAAINFNLDVQVRLKYYLVTLVTSVSNVMKSHGSPLWRFILPIILNDCLQFWMTSSRDVASHRRFLLHVHLTFHYRVRIVWQMESPNMKAIN